MKNDSRYFAEGPFRVSVYCSADAALKPKDPRFDRGEDVRVGEVDIEGLSAGVASHEKVVNVVVPKNAREGYRFLLAVTDDTDAVAETDERDNVALEPIIVLAPERVARRE